MAHDLALGHVNQHTVGIFLQRDHGHAFGIDLDKLAGYRKVKDAEYGRLLLGPFHFVHDDFSLLAEIPKGDSLSWRLVTSEIEQDADQEFQTLDANSDWHDLSLSVQNDALKNKTIYVELRLKSASVFGIKTDNSHKRFR